MNHNRKEVFDMAKKATETTKKAVETKQASVERSESGVYCYIGPNLKDLLQTGKTFIGTREEALAKAADAIAAYPLVKRLIVTGEMLSKARLDVKKPGNTLYDSYQKLAKEVGRKGR